jgi:hypothetical protein
MEILQYLQLGASTIDPYVVDNDDPGGYFLFMV